MGIFRYEWITADPYPEPMAHRTMAKLKIVIGDCVATDIYDHYLKEPRDHVCVPISRIAEWLVLNWWYLWFEAGSVSATDRNGFAARHDLARAGHGFLLPRLSLQPFGDQMRVSVSRWRPRYAPLTFRSECDVLVPRLPLERELRTLIENVVKRLHETDTPCHELEADWQDIRSIEPEESEFCQAAALVGLDPFSLPDRTAEAIEHLWNKSPRTLREDALYGADASSLDAIGRWLPRQLTAVEEIESGQAWREIRGAIRGSLTAEDLPWRRGYSAAQAVRGELDAPWGQFPLEQSDAQKVGNREVVSPSPRIEGCVASDSPSCVVVHKRSIGKRFLLARALGDYMTRNESGPAILGTRYAGRQAESRAFAAEFLAPSKWLRRQVGGALSVDREAVDELAHEAGVSSWVIQHQLRNHGIAEIADFLWPAHTESQPDVLAEGWSD